MCLHKGCPSDSIVSMLGPLQNIRDSKAQFKIKPDQTLYVIYAYPEVKGNAPEE